MFHPALWKLLQLLRRGSFRRFCKSLTTIRGLFFAGFILVMSLYGLGSLYFASVMTSKSPQVTEAMDKAQTELLPLMFFAATCYVILFSTGEASVSFTGSEVAFLFPAPITRKQLLSYTLLKSLMGVAAVSVFFGIFTSPSLSMAIPRWLAIVMTLAFLQLLTMNVAFVRNLFEENVHIRVRRVASLIIGLAVLVALLQTAQYAGGQDLLAIWAAFRNSTVVAWLLSPFQIFVQVLRARDWATFLPYAGVLLAVDLLLLQLAYRLDALSLETALAASEKMAARIKLLQTKGAMHVFGPATSAVAERKVPKLPYWGGVGPVLWRQLTTTFRSSSKLVWVAGGAIAFAAFIVYSSGSSGDPKQAIIGPIMSVAAMAYMSFLLSLMLQNDIEHVGYLKSLPLQSTAIVIGEWIGFPVLLSIVQTLFIAVLSTLYPQFAIWMLAGATLILPLNLLLFGVDKLIFYIYPTRMAKGAPGDFQNSGKQMVFMALKMLMLGGAVLITVLASLPGAIALQSPVVAIGCAGFVLIIECAALIPLLTFAFDRFDPSSTVTS